MSKDVFIDVLVCPLVLSLQHGNRDGQGFPTVTASGDVDFQAWILQ